MAISSQTPLSPQLRRNFLHLYLDILWVGVTSGSTIAFLGIYAARLGASSMQMAFLGAGPALVSLLMSLPVGRYLENRSLVRAAFLSAFLARLGYVALIFLPWLFVKSGQIWGSIGIILVMSIPATVLNISFNSLFAGVVPPEYRATVVGRRNAIVAAVTTVVAFGCGQILDRLSFPTNYQIVFGIGAAGALISCYHIIQIRLPGEAGDTSSQANRSALLRLDVLRGPFGVFMVAYLLFYIFMHVPAPLFALFNVNELHLTDGDIGIGNALMYIFMTAVSLVLHRISSHLGHRKLLVASSLFFGGYPLLLYFAHGRVLFWVALIYAGAVWALIGGGLTNRLMERVPENDRPAHMAIFNLVANLGILIGMSLGPIGGDWLGLRNMMLVGAILRFVGGFILWKWG